MAVWTFSLSAVYLPQHSGFVRTANRVTGTVTKVDGSPVTVMQSGSVVPRVTTDDDGSVAFTVDRTALTGAPEVVVDFGFGALRVKADEYGDYLASIANGPTASAIDAHLGGDATDLVAKVAGKVDENSSYVSAAKHGLSPTATGTANTTALQEALDAAASFGVPEVRITTSGTYNIAGSIIMRPNVTLRGSKAVTLNYTGAGSFLVQPTPGTRVYNMGLSNLSITGPGSGTSTVGVDLDSVSTSRFDDVVVSGFGKAWRIASAINGGAVYNTFVNCNGTTSGTGFSIEASGSNATRFFACRANGCTTGLSITDSNNTTWVGGQVEANTTGVYITATTNGLSDNNLIADTRFENNTTAWNVASANVRYAQIVNPLPFGTYTISDTGTATTAWGGGGPTVNHYMTSAVQSTNGSWRLTRTANGGTETPAVVFEDSNTAAGTPVTVLIKTGRATGWFWRGTTGGVTKAEVTALGQGRFVAGIGVGNSAAATTPGTVVRKIEVFDATGVSLGFVPVYSSIT